jgi:hypothetical protein
MSNKEIIRIMVIKNHSLDTTVTIFLNKFFIAHSILWLSWASSNPEFISLIINQLHMEYLKVHASFWIIFPLWDVGLLGYMG